MGSQSDLIAAKATPESTCAIAVVRLSGRGASRTVEGLMRLPEGRLEGRKRAVGRIPGVDRVVAISWPEGRSYTGEEMVDIMCHGTPGTSTEIMRLLIESGARAAEPGEFTRRAWLNGKITDTEILILSARMRNISTGRIQELTELLANLLMETEALIEFGEEHETASDEEISRNLGSLKKLTCEMRDGMARMEIMPRVYIMGPVNAGKSTLFNLLCGERAALVSHVPGTTRDGASRTVEIRGRRIELRDTAGTGGEGLDGQALELAYGGMRREDRIIWMDPEESEPEGLLREGHRVLRLSSRNDEGGKVKEGWLAFSNLSGAGMDQVEDFIAAPEEGSPSWQLDSALRNVEEAHRAWKREDLALAAELLKMAMENVHSSESASAAVERALDNFCVGK